MSNQDTITSLMMTAGMVKGAAGGIKSGAKRAASGAGRMKDWVKEKSGKGDSSADKESPKVIKATETTAQATGSSNKSLESIDKTLKILVALMTKQAIEGVSRFKSATDYRAGVTDADTADTIIQRRAFGYERGSFLADTIGYKKETIRSQKQVKAGQAAHKDQELAERVRESIDESGEIRNLRLEEINKALGGGGSSSGGGSGPELKGEVKSNQDLRGELLDAKEDMFKGKDAEGNDVDYRKYSNNAYRTGEKMSDISSAEDRVEQIEKNKEYAEAQDKKKGFGLFGQGTLTGQIDKVDKADTDPGFFSDAKKLGADIVKPLLWIGEGIYTMLAYDKREEKLAKKLAKLEKRKDYIDNMKRVERGKLNLDPNLAPSSKLGGQKTGALGSMIDKTKSKQGGGMFSGLIGKALSPITGMLGKLVVGVLGALGITAAFGFLKDAIMKKVDAVKKYLKDKVDKISKKFTDAWTSVKEKAGALKDKVVKKTKDIAGKVKDKVVAGAKVVKDKVVAGAKVVKDKVAKKASEVGGKAKDWWNKGKDSKTNMKDLGGKEKNAPWKKLLANDKKQMTRSDKSFKAGGKGLKGLNPLKAFSLKQLKTGPSPMMRQAVERPLAGAKKFGENLKKPGGVSKVAKSGAQAVGKGASALGRGAMTLGRGAISAAPAIGGAVASGATAVAGAAGSAMSGIGALAAANPIGAAVLATAAIGAGGYMLWDKMRGTDDAKEAFDAAEEAGLVDHDVMGNSEILDWEGIKKLNTKALDGLIEYDDWSSEDMDKLKQIKETGEIDDKITKKKHEAFKDKRVADRVERKSESVTGRHQMMTDEEGNTSMTKHNFGRAGIKERNAMLATGSRQATRDEVDQLVDDTRDKADNSASELRALEARKIELNQSGDKLKKGQSESGVSGQSSGGPQNVVVQGGSTGGSTSTVTNHFNAGDPSMIPAGMNQKW
jgi:hypothetical protein